MNRRKFIKSSSMAAGGLIIAPGMQNFFSQDLQNSIFSGDTPRVSILN